DRTQRRVMLVDRRVETYRDLLDVERRLRRLLASRRSFSREEYSKWWAEYQKLHNLTVITGTESVRTSSESLANLYGRIDADRMSFGSERLADALTRAFLRHEPEIEGIRVQLVEAMRADVAPGAEDVLTGAAAPAGPVPEVGQPIVPVVQRVVAAVSTSEVV